MLVRCQHKKTRTLDRTQGLWERILEALEAKNAPEVARKLHKTKQAAYEWRDGKPPGLETLIDIAETSNVSLSWLILNRGPKRLPDNNLAPRRPFAGDVKTLDSPELKALIRREIIQVLADVRLSDEDKSMVDKLVAVVVDRQIKKK